MAKIFTHPLILSSSFIFCCNIFANHYWLASSLARESPKLTPSHVWITSSLLPFHADIIPTRTYSLPQCPTRGYLKWALLIVDYSQCRCHMASVLCPTTSDLMEHSPLYSARSKKIFVFATLNNHGPFLQFPIPIQLHIPPALYCLITPSCIYISTIHTSYINIYPLTVHLSFRS